ncbi:Canalicular multispecific organic anion transporter 2 [Tolypocladium ophioglossoides CBS 100239]|uniref:Canalicular multispecific organic anion transporter 2 n=1 Tax=Tolypocladium ophioglossoides (strain CBS 100239) TaxID=1163406 RepID=A0A0L0MYG9_TOLOC|nr:Canalicular multispecific organic anion transporter 2 [Tolypocladium ophioglossoides CBS 100239]
MSALASCPDDSFGPWAGRTCRGGFDFTLLFEESILSILLSSLFLLAAPSPILKLVREPVKVRSNPLNWSKRIVSLCFVGLSAALVGLLATDSNASADSAITHTRATIPSAVLTFVLSLVYVLLSVLEHRSSIRPSSLISIYLGLSILFDTARARTMWLLDNANVSAIPAVFTASLALKAVMLLLESTEKRSILRDEYCDAAPESVSGPYNLGVFYWLSTLFFTGYRKVLEPEDLFPLDDELQSEALAKTMFDAWDKGLLKSAPHISIFASWRSVFHESNPPATDNTFSPVPDKTVPNALVSTWLGAFSKALMMPVIPRLFQIGFTYAQPFLVTAAINLAASPQTQPYNNSGYGLIGAYILVYAGIAVSMGQYEWRNYRAATMMRGSLIPLVYQKSLLLDSSASSTFSPTAALTLVSTDIETITSGLVQVHETWSNLVEIAIAIYLLERQLGAACVMGVAFALAVMVGTVFLAKPTGTHQAAWIQASQIRVSATSKALGSIKWLKISGLSDVAFSVIRNLRVRELAISTKFRLLLGISLILSICTPILGPLVTFATFAGIALRSNSTLTIATVFTSFSIIVLLNGPLAKIVTALPQIAGAVASFQRIQNHLNIEERKDARVALGHHVNGRDAADDSAPVTPSHNSTAEKANSAETVRTKSESLATTISESDVISSICGKFSWHREESPAAEGDNEAGTDATDAAEQENAVTPVIDISPCLDIPRRALTLILGPVGCGKSTLLKAFLGELSDFEGTIKTQYFGAVTYCDQNPWLPNETVREIICGNPATDEQGIEKEKDADDDEWYRVVIRACELERDMQIWPRGDKTPVGSKGISMSGGQKQRLSIARAIYARRELLLLDDVFSGLDANTEDVVFDNLLGEDGLVRKANMTVIVVSSDVRRVPYADKVVVLNENGQLRYAGSPADLKQATDLDWAIGKTQTKNSRAGAKDTRQSQEASDGDGDELRETHTNPGAESEAVVQGVMQSAEVEADSARQMGDSAVYKFYAQSAGWFTMTTFIISICIFAFCDTFPSVWLKWWAEANEKEPNANLGKWLGVYAVLGIGAITACLFGTWQLFIITINRSGLYFHNLLVDTVSRTPMSFHTTTDSGITVNRFSQDLQLIDMELPAAALGVVIAFSFGIAQFILVCVSSKYMAALLPFLLGVLYAIQHFYLRTARQLRLLDIEYKAPLYTQLMETITGIVTIRAFGWESRSTAKTMRILNASQQPSYLLYCVQRWITFAVNAVIMMLAVVLIVLTTTLREAIGPGYVGIALSNILAFSATMQATITSWVTLEIALGAVARIRSFALDVRSEDDEASECLAKQGRDEQLLEPLMEGSEEKRWPSHGHIELQGISASYPGKSSLFLSLLGLISQDSGTITIDGVDLSTLPREYVRSHLVAVPQEAYIVDGTVRLNADPHRSKDSLGSESLSEARDQEIIRVLERVGLWDKIKSRGGLDMVIDNSFLSQGQAQLMVLARAMLRQGESRVLLLDEATSSLDESTSSLIDEVVRTWFHDWTVLAIAHKLDAILDYDKVAVLDDGRLVEFDAPRKLLAQGNSVFKELYLLATNSTSVPVSAEQQ